MQTFTVLLDAHGAPRGVDVDGRGERPLKDFDEEKIRPLILLALMTARNRADPKSLEKCPSLHDLSPLMCTYLAEAAFNRRNFQPKEKMAKKHWLLDVFTVPPRGKFLSGTRTAGASRVKFLKNVLVVIDRPGAYSGSELDIIIRDYYTEKESMLQPELLIRVHLPTNGPTEIKEIASDLRRGNLVTNIELWIELISNFNAAISVFWVCSDGESHWLFPFSDIENVTGNKTDGDHGSIIEIGKEGLIQIYEPAGNHMCIALVGVSEVSVADGIEITKRLPQVFPEGYRMKKLRNPRFETLVLDVGEGHQRGMGAAPPRQPWREKLKEILSSHGDKAYIFTIPHQ